MKVSPAFISDRVKMDPDVARYFRETGTSAERINSVLRAYVEAQRKSA